MPYIYTTPETLQGLFWSQFLTKEFLKKNDFLNNSVMQFLSCGSVLSILASIAPLEREIGENTPLLFNSLESKE